MGQVKQLQQLKGSRLNIQKTAIFSPNSIQQMGYRTQPTQIINLTGGEPKFMRP